MLISIHDSSLRRVAYMDNEAPKTLHYYNDTWRRLLAEATSTFSFTVDKTGVEAETFLTEKNYLSFKHNGKQYLFSIMKTEETEHTINVYAENLNLELLHETIAPIDMTVSHDLVWYLNEAKIIKGGGLVVGTNEVSDQTRKIKLESEQTALARLLSIANNFNAEVEFSTFLNNDGSFEKMVVNFYKKYDGNNQGVGTNRQDVTLYYGKNVEGITRTVDKTELFTQITPTGKDGLSIVGIEKIEYDENGNIEFFSPKSLSSIYAPQASEMYPSQLLTEDNNYINHQYAADGTSNVETLYSLALNELKKYAYPAVTYEVTGFYDLDIGDTVKIQDEKFAPVLLIQARVAEQSISFSDPSKNKTIFGNILALESRVSQDLTGRLKELVDQAAPYRFETVSDNGLTFKNNEGNTTLTARVYKGSNIEEVSVDSFEWLLDGVSFGGTTKSQLVSASQVTGTSVVRYNAKIGDTVIGGLEVTIVDVSDGTNGISPTIKINPDTSLTIVDAKGTSTTPVLKGTDGVDGTDGIAGKDGVGVKTTVITYAISTSGTTAPTTGWTSTVTSLVKGQYLWTKTVWTYTDNSSETGYSVTYISKDGNNGVDGIAGKDGVGIKSTAVTYAGSTSGTTNPTTWTTTIPSVVAGSYLWTRYIWTYTDNTSETGYSIAKMGDTGPKGDTGSPGAPGSNGQDAITIVMTNDNVTLPANALGGVTSYANSGTTFSVFVGNTQCIPLTSAPVSVENSFSVVSSTSGISIGSKTFNTTDKVIAYGNHSGMSATSGATATITYTIVVRVNGTNTTFTKVQNFTKAEKGITGDDGVDNFTYFRYSPYPDGRNMTSLPNADSKYLGIVVTTAATAPNSNTSYSWSKYAGNDANKYGDNVIFNPKWDNIPFGTLNSNDANLLNGGWNVGGGTVEILAPESDAPSENIIKLSGADNYFISKGIPVMPGERYVMFCEVKTSDYANMGSVVTSQIGGYPSTNDASIPSRTGRTTNAQITVNGTITNPNGLYIDTTNSPAITNNNWNIRSKIIEVQENTSYLRPVLYCNTANGSNKFRKLELRKIQQGAVTISSTEPSFKYVGMQWQYTGTSAVTIGGVAIQPKTVYIWSGSVWQLHVMRSTNLQVDNGFISNAMIGDATIESAKIKSLDAVKVNATSLSTISADLGDVSAGTVKLLADVDVNGTLKKHGIYQSKMGLLSSGPSLATPSTLSNSQMGVANLNKGELRFIVTDYTENLKNVQDTGMSDPNTAFINFNSYDNGKDVMLIGSSGDIVFKGITSQDTPWITVTDGVKYKYMFSRIYISFAITGTSAQYMQFGFLPESKRPLADLFLTLTAWSTGVQNDRHVQIRASDGAIILWNPVSNQNYNGEVSFTI